jgi:hypothetical protein
MEEGDALSPLLLNFPLENAIRKVLANQEGLKLNGTHRLLVYADNVNIHTVRKNTEDLVIASKETGSAVNAEKIKYMIWSCLEIRMQEKNGNTKIGNKLF